MVALVLRTGRDATRWQRVLYDRRVERNGSLARRFAQVDVGTKNPHRKISSGKVAETGYAQAKTHAPRGQGSSARWIMVHVMISPAPRNRGACSWWHSIVSGRIFSGMRKEICGICQRRGDGVKSHRSCILFWLVRSKAAHICLDDRCVGRHRLEPALEHSRQQVVSLANCNV